MSAGMKVQRSSTPPTVRPLVVRGQGAKPLYQRKDGTTTAADDAALVAALVKRARQGARRLRLVAKGAILAADCPSFKV